MGVFSRLAFWKKEIEALPEGTGQEVNITKNSHKEFVNSMKSKSESINSDSKIAKEEDARTIVYDVKGFEKVLDWKDWYNTAEKRNLYYSYNTTQTIYEKMPTYNGALVIRRYEVEGGLNTINCISLNPETREREEIELAKIKEPSEKEIKRSDYISIKDAMQTIDSIISLQVRKAYTSEYLTKNIQINFERLQKMKNINLSVLGEQILSYGGEGKMVLEDIPYELLYEKRVDFDSLDLKKSLIQLPYECMQADIEGKSPESIDKIVEAFIEYSELAIDIGCIDKWDEIDKMNKELQKYRFDGHNEPGDVKYNRKPTFKEESYKKIKDKFLNKHQVEIIDKIEDKETSSGFISQKDIQENFIHRVTGTNMANLEFIAKTDVEDLSVKLGGYIEKYKELHGEDHKYDKKINLLNDMVVYSQVVILESVRDTNRNRKQTIQEDPEQEQ